jgi:hypothetical protein
MKEDVLESTSVVLAGEQHSGSTGMAAGTIRAPKLKIRKRRPAGQVRVFAHGRPDTRLSLTGKKTTYSPRLIQAEAGGIGVVWTGGGSGDAIRAQRRLAARLPGGWPGSA